MAPDYAHSASARAFTPVCDGLWTRYGLHPGYELPINIPARNTSTPPTTTWNAAERNGVSM
jgi:hypothetical protein